MNRILAQPVQPDLTRKCPHCDKRQALELLRDKSGADLMVYRCRYCDRTTRYAVSHPPGAV